VIIIAYMFVNSYSKPSFSFLKQPCRNILGHIPVTFVVVVGLIQQK